MAFAKVRKRADETQRSDEKSRAGGKAACRGCSKVAACPESFLFLPPVHTSCLLSLQDILRCSKEVRMPHNGESVCIRIGLHTGPCVSGLVGFRLPKFSIVGKIAAFV